MKCTILFAEDERGIRKYLQEELQAAGYEVIVTSDGVDALEVVRNSPVDLVIVDEHMPRVSGLEAARQIKQMDPTLPIILFTGDRAYEACRSPFIDAAIIKNEDLTELKSEVASLLFDELESASLSSLRVRENTTK